MAEYVELGGGYLLDKKSKTVRTMMATPQPDGSVICEIRYVATYQTFLAWHAMAKDIVAQIYEDLAGENVVAMSAYRDHADTG